MVLPFHLLDLLKLNLIRRETYLFAVHGQFPSKEIVKVETYLLSFEKLEHLAKEQLKLLEYPSFEQKKLFPVYAMEEVYVTNNQMTKIPFEIFVDVRSYLQIDKTIYWDKYMFVVFVIPIIPNLRIEQEKCGLNDFYVRNIQKIVETGF